MIAVGMVSVDNLSKALADKVPSIQNVGDCLKPSMVKEAIESGFVAGTKV